MNCSICHLMIILDASSAFKGKHSCCRKKYEPYKYFGENPYLGIDDSNIYLIGYLIFRNL